MAKSEICVQCYSTLTTVKKHLVANGFVLKDHYFQLDNYITHLSREEVKKAPYAKIMENTILLRRYKGDRVGSYLVYKHQLLNDDDIILSEDKVQAQVANMEDIQRIFSMVRVYNWAKYTVEEFEYTKNNIVIKVQNVSSLGTFIEIEEPKNMHGTAAYKLQDLTYLANSLGLDLGKDYDCKKNYMLYKKQNRITS